MLAPRVMVNIRKLTIKENIGFIAAARTLQQGTSEGLIPTPRLRAAQRIFFTISNPRRPLLYILVDSCFVSGK